MICWVDLGGATVVGWLGLDGGCVGLWVCSRWREREREREKEINERREMVLGYIFYCVDILF